MSAFNLISLLGHMPGLFSLYSIDVFSGEKKRVRPHDK